MRGFNLAKSLRFRALPHSPSTTSSAAGVREYSRARAMSATPQRQATTRLQRQSARVVARYERRGTALGRLHGASESGGFCEVRGARALMRASRVSCPWC